MRKTVLPAPLIAGLVMVLSLSTAEADLITFKFGGQVTSITDPGGHLNGLVTIGQYYSGSYTFDPATPDLFSGDPTIGDFACIDHGMSVMLGTLTINPPNSRITVGNYASGDLYVVSMYGSTASSNLTVVEMGVNLRKGSNGVFTDDLLPIIPPDVSMFSTRYLWVQLGPITGKESILTGTVAYLVPEPTCSLLIMTALVGFAMKRRPMQPPSIPPRRFRDE